MTKLTRSRAKLLDDLDRIAHDYGDKFGEDAARAAQQIRKDGATTVTVGNVEFTVTDDG